MDIEEGTADEEDQYLYIICEIPEDVTKPIEPENSTKPRTAKQLEYSCIVCSKTFPHHYLLSHHKHVYKHFRHTLLKCDVCLKLIKAVQYRPHVLRHRCEKLEKCKIFSKRYNNKGSPKPHKNDRTFDCPFCSKRYAQKDQLNGHIKKHEDGLLPVKRHETFTCSFCARPFRTPGRLVTHHKYLHAADSPNECMCFVCGLLVETINFNDHIKTLHGKSKKYKRYECDVCKEPAYGCDELRKHKTKHENNLNTCSYCDKSYVNRSSLVIHVRLHTGERPFVCEHCDKTFRSKIFLQKHLVVHKGATGATDKAYACETCGKIFAANYMLYNHALLHTGIKPYVCNICDKAFAKRNAWRDHVRRHNGEKPFKCSHCDKRFASHSGLYAHKKIHDKFPSRHVCHVCNKGFHVRNAWKKHIETHGVIPHVFK